MAIETHVRLDEVVGSFESLDDPRSTINHRHPSSSVLVIAVTAVLAGAGGPTAIARRAEIKKDLQSRVWPLSNGVPRKDVFRRLLSALQPAAFQACFADWLNVLRANAAAAAGVEQPILALDGKTLRRSHWGIENSCHWSLDVTNREDDSRIREARLRKNYAWLNRLTLSLLKQHLGKGSIAVKRRSCA